MQIELENEFNLISDYAELTQAFKIAPGMAKNSSKQQHQHQPVSAGAAPVHPRSAPFNDEPPNPPRWEIRTPESKRQPQQQQYHEVLNQFRLFSMASVVVRVLTLSLFDAGRPRS